MSSSSQSSGKYTNDRYLNTPQKIGKIELIDSFKPREKIRKMNTSEGEVVDDDLHCHLVDIMGENNENIEKTYPQGSFARLFWEEQQKAASVSNFCQVWWHPVMCLNLKLLSSAAYHALRTSGFIKLPSERTLL